MNPEQEWHVIFTRPNCEKKVAQILSQRGVETYCPLQRSTGKWQSRETASSKPLFPSWVFVRCNSSQLTELAKCKGVINIVYWLGNPAVVPQEQINIIKFVLSRFNQIQLLKTGLQNEKNVSPLHENTMLFPLASLGYSLAVPKETENVSELIGAKALNLSANRQPQVRARFSNLLRQLPTLLAARKTAI